MAVLCMNSAHHEIALAWKEYMDRNDIYKLFFTSDNSGNPMHKD